MARGAESKEVVFNKLQEVFKENAFRFNDGKEMRINLEEGGERCQIKVVLTCVKSPVTAGSDNAIPKKEVKEAEAVKYEEPTETEISKLKELLSKVDNV